MLTRCKKDTRTRLTNLLASLEATRDKRNSRAYPVRGAPLLYNCSAHSRRGISLSPARPAGPSPPSALPSRLHFAARSGASGLVAHTVLAAVEGGRLVARGGAVLGEDDVAHQVVHRLQALDRHLERLDVRLRLGQLREEAEASRLDVLVAALELLDVGRPSDAVEVDGAAPVVLGNGERCDAAETSFALSKGGRATRAR